MTNSEVIQNGKPPALPFPAMGISLCMIVKNEEDSIEATLESVRSAVDEITIADTDRADSTIRRARRFQPKTIDFKWIDSFANVRNQALAEARHPWVLDLDANERIARYDLPKLTEHAKAALPNLEAWPKTVERIREKLN